VIRKYLPGDTVQLTVNRDGDTRTLTAVLGEAPTS
jgi:S1-C subfamily serine protease